MPFDWRHPISPHRWPIALGRGYRSRCYWSPQWEKTKIAKINWDFNSPYEASRVSRSSFRNSTATKTGTWMLRCSRRRSGFCMWVFSKSMPSWASFAAAWRGDGAFYLRRNTLATVLQALGVNVFDIRVYQRLGVQFSCARIEYVTWSEPWYDEVTWRKENHAAVHTPLLMDGI